MIKVNVKIVGTLSKPSGKTEFQYECTEGTTLHQLLIELKYNEKHLPHIIAAVNGEKKSHNFVLKNNDSVALTTVVGGG